MANPMNDLGEMIFLDRYALKDIKKDTLSVGDTVIVCVDQKTRQREVGEIVELGTRGQKIKVKLRSGVETEQSWDDVDKPFELTAEDTMARVARGVADVETVEENKQKWESNFRWLLDDWRFIPGGRILAAAGTQQKLSLLNCYVIPSPVDSRAGIVKTLSEMMEIMSRGGGVGINLSTLRPQHAYVKGVNGRSSGSVSWGGLYSFVTGLIEQGGSRRGALMLMLNDWHPDLINFINVKREAGKITNANISVGVSDAFMEAVKNDEMWSFKFPDSSAVSQEEYEKVWDGDIKKWEALGLPVVVYREEKARDIWNQLIQSAWASAEPGVVFLERYNTESNSHYFENIVCTNPCGEQGLPPYSSCLLGALNLSKFISGSDVNWDDLGKAVKYAVRFLDNVIDANPVFLEEIGKQSKYERRMGLGIMGLAEMLIRLELRYGSVEGNKFIDKLGKFLAVTAYTASSEIAKEKGSFPAFDADKLLQSGYAKRLPASVRKLIKENGLRNVTLLTVAPTGSTGTMVGTSTGVEPYFSWSYFRKSRLGTHEEKIKVAQDWLDLNPGKELPPWFVTSMDLTPEEHVMVQASLQRWIDSSISKTCNAPNGYTVEQTRDLYELLYSSGCKGGTIYRDGSRSEQVLNLKEEPKEPTKEAAKEQAKEEKPAAKSRKKSRDRPKMTTGVTVEKDSPLGHVFTTLNVDENNDPVEVFIIAGKTGSDIASMSEALGRTISLMLRIENMSPLDRLSALVDQLEGIGGSNSVGMGKNKIKSMPDSVAKAIQDIMVKIATKGSKEEPEPKEEAHDAQSVIVAHPVKGKRRVQMDICPRCGESALVSEEGCQHCTNCAYSRCG